MNAKPFLDTNVILYAFRQGDSRSQKAEALLAKGGAHLAEVLFDVSVGQTRLAQLGRIEVGPLAE